MQARFLSKGGVTRAGSLPYASLMRNQFFAALLLATAAPALSQTSLRRFRTFATPR